MRFYRDFCKCYSIMNEGKKSEILTYCLVHVFSVFKPLGFDCAVQTHFTKNNSASRIFETSPSLIPNSFSLSLFKFPHLLLSLIETA